MKSYKKFEDPGHGWLQVPLSEIKELGVGKDISGCSYKDKKHAYLEEDRDQWIFLAAAKAAGWEYMVINSWPIDDESPVRSMRSYLGKV